MRIATWNCARGPWAKKREFVASLKADVAIVTEAPVAAAKDGLHWYGNHLARNGTTIVVAPGFECEPLPPVASAPCVNAVKIHGPIDFTALLVWTWPAAPHKNYKQPLLDGLAAYRHLPGPFVIAGDFNGNACFDRPRSRLKWIDCFRAVEDLGVASAYHSFFGEAYGCESRPTQYQTRKESMRFHLDYVFVPREWCSRIRDVRVPGFNEYDASDHRPVIVDVAV